LLITAIGIGIVGAALAARDLSNSPTPSVPPASSAINTNVSVLPPPLAVAPVTLPPLHKIGTLTPAQAKAAASAPVASREAVKAPGAP
jgi:hypothetical protein